MAEAKVLPKAVLEAIEKGKVVFYGEYRRGACVQFPGKGGKVYHQSKEVVETGEGVITVTSFLPDGVDAGKWAPQFNKGTMVMGICDGLENNSGATVARAKLVAVS